MKSVFSKDLGMNLLSSVLNMIYRLDDIDWQQNCYKILKYKQDLKIALLSWHSPLLTEISSK